MESEKNTSSVSVGEAESMHAIRRQLNVVKEMTLTWRNIYAYAAKKPDRWFHIKKGKQETKCILKNVSGEARPGQLLAIMGSSGAGKTTLMNVLTGRNLHLLDVEGSVLLNGKKRSRALKKLVAYVQQEDLFIGTLTVREHLVFQALLRMDRHIPYQQRIERVDAVMSELRLDKCAHTVIGTPGIKKGASGGELKRLAFASELLMNPSLLFCDEPTSGLDSYMAQSVVQVLREMASAGRTILCTIHQPSSEVYALFDHILLVASGRVAFMGEAKHALPFFRQLGHQCPPNYNPADFFIAELSVIPGKDSSQDNVAEICEAFEKSSYAKDILLTPIVETPIPDYSSMGSLESFFPEDKSRYKTSWCAQLVILFSRSFLSVKREPILTTIRLGQSLVVSVLFAMVFWQQPLTQEGIMNINGVMFLILTSMTFQNGFAVITTFCAELPLFFREHASAMYRVDTYFLGKTLAELPIFVAIPIIFVSILYFSVGLRLDAEAFFTCMSVAILVANTGCSYGYLISCISSNPTAAVSIAPPLITPMMIFGGFFLNINSVPVYFIWIKYLSWYQYGYEVLVINQWSEIKNISCGHTNTQICISSGDQVIKYYNFTESAKTHDFLLLCVLLLVYRFLAYVILWIRVKFKK